MSGVQVDHSPAVATHTLDISSWTDADLSALTSSEKKRYYRRKSAIQDYFTTEESLSQIASRHHLPVRMLEKLTKKCEMRHEDGSSWGYRALVPGVTVVDHSPMPEPTPEAESASASPDDTTRAETVDAIREEKTDSTETHGDEEATTSANADDGVDEETDRGADAIHRVPTEPVITADNDAVGTRFIASDPDGSAETSDNVATPSTANEETLDEETPDNAETPSIASEETPDTPEILSTANANDAVAIPDDHEVAR